jgi:predicted nucleic acid-binding protein
MTSCFCDTSAIIKLYHNEIGTDRMESIFGDERSEIIISELTTAEFYSALTRKVRTGEITNEAEDAALRNFRKDCRDRFIVTPLNSETVRQAVNVISRHGNRFSIRTLDALQLAACLSENSDDLKFVCADLNFIRICGLEGIAVINPEADEEESRY